MFNRDEDLSRPTIPLKSYDDTLLYSLDEISGGTFLCINKKTGNFACLLNHPRTDNPYKEGLTLKRGAIPIDFCKIEFNEESLNKFFDNLKKTIEEYNGYNFVCGNFNVNYAYYFTNNFSDKGIKIDQLPIVLNDKSIHGVENKFLYEDSVRVNHGIKLFKETLSLENDKNSENLFEVVRAKVMENHTKLTDIKKLDKKDIEDPIKFKLFRKGCIYIKDKENISDEEHFFEFGTRQTISIQVDESNTVKITERFGGIEKHDNSKLIINREKDTYKNITYSL